MYRQYEDPRRLERELERVEEEYQRFLEDGGVDDDGYWYERISDLKDRINFAWQDEEYDENYMRENYGDEEWMQDNVYSAEDVNGNRRKRLDGIISQVKATRRGDGRAWIYDDNGNIASGVICGDVLPLLESLKSEELDVTDEEIEYILEDPNTKGDNTYNYGANISNDLNINTTKDVEINGEYYDDIMVIMVHLFGDIRGGYSDYFVVPLSFEDLVNDYSDDIYQYIDINDRYSADVNIFSEGYTVYDNEIGEDVGEFYEPEVEDLLKELGELE